MKKAETTPLPDLEAGQSGTVKTLNCGPGFINRMAAMGLSPGARVTVTQNFKKRPLIIMARSTFIALSRTEAGSVLVVKKEHAQVSR
ncbi:MAG: FeoA family protein [Desulfobacteraceae bacterium]|jgi:Fe2+ transport system protein FeoA